MDTTGIIPSTRPLQAINNADLLLALCISPSFNPDVDLVQWEQLVDCELAQLAHFTKDGERRLQNAIIDLGTARDIDEHTQASVEYHRIKDQLAQLDIASDKLAVARRRVPALLLASTAPIRPARTTPSRAYSESTKANAILIGVLLLLLIAGSVLALCTTPALLRSTVDRHQTHIASFY